MKTGLVHTILCSVAMFPASSPPLGTYIMQPKKLGWSLRTMLYCNALSMRLLTCLWAFYLVSGIYLHMYYVISSVPINH